MSDGWMHISVELPEAEGAALLAFLRGELEFIEIDFCELQRPDRARVSYGPCERPTSSGYTTDPFLPDLPHVLRAERPDHDQP